MAYKILYLEDEDPGSIKHQIEYHGYEVITDDAGDVKISISKLFEENIDACLFDFRLTTKAGIFDAPSIAQSIRTEGINHRNIPIVLISNDVKIKDFETDLTSQDLFDFAVSKEDFLADASKYLKQIASFIVAYKKIKNDNFSLDKILGLNNTQLKELVDYRFINRLNNPLIEKSIYGYCMSVHRTFIRRVGALIGEDILSARLGVSKDSKDWDKLLERLISFRYNGILNDIYPRWWMNKIQEWWDEITERAPLRRMNSQERSEVLSQKLNLDLTSISAERHSSSTSFWTICSISKKPLDPFDGYILNKREEFSWVEQDYISINSALEYPENMRYLSENAKEELRTFKS